VDHLRAQILTEDTEEALTDFSHDVEDAMCNDGALYVRMINQIPSESLQGPLVVIDPCVDKRNRVLRRAFDCGPH
jgi:hypothetical protein